MQDLGLKTQNCSRSRLKTQSYARSMLKKAKLCKIYAKQRKNMQDLRVKNTKFCKI